MGGVVDVKCKKSEKGERISNTRGLHKIGGLGTLNQNQLFTFSDRLESVKF